MPALPKSLIIADLRYHSVRQSTYQLQLYIRLSFAAGAGVGYSDGTVAGVREEKLWNCACCI